MLAASLAEDPQRWTRIGAGTRSVPQALWAPDGERVVASAELHGTALPNGRAHHRSATALAGSG